jgi:hypothetical protein
MFEIGALFGLSAAVALWSDAIANTWWQKRLDQLKAGELGNFLLH